jgi:hypothetical protein
MVLATPVSYASTCCVRSAMRTDFSVGSASVSSMELVCSDCVPPSTAAMAWYATRTMLFSGCGATSETPAVWAWVRSRHDSGFFAPYTSRRRFAQMRRAARNLAISSKKSLCTSKKNDRRGAKSSTSRPALDAALHVLEAVAQRVRQLLYRRGARLPDVVAADGDGVVLRRVLRAPLEHVHDELQRRLRRVDPRVLRLVLLQDVVLDGAPQLVRRHALLLRRHDVEAEQDDGRPIDGHGDGDVAQRDAVEQRFHVGQRS